MEVETARGCLVQLISTRALPLCPTLVITSCRTLSKAATRTDLMLGSRSRCKAFARVRLQQARRAVLLLCPDSTSPWLARAQAAGELPVVVVASSASR
jgi:hypothetical protein